MVQEAKKAEYGATNLPVPGQSGVPDTFKPGMLLQFCAQRTQVVPRALQDILRNPAAVRQTIDLAYQHPELIETAGNRRTTPETLESIRIHFPDTIKNLPESVLSGMLAQFPALQTRVTEDRKLLGEVSGMAVEPAEVVISILIQDGRISRRSAEAYQQVAASHNLYGVIAEKLLISGNSAGLSRKEEDSLTEIGQALLKTKKMFEIGLPQYDQDGTLTPHQSRERDFNGIMARLRVCSRMIGLLTANGGSAEVLADLVTSARAEIGSLYDLHPDRAREFQDIVGGVEGAIKLARWKKVPGGPDFTTAEATSFLHAGE